MYTKQRILLAVVLGLVPVAAFATAQADPAGVAASARATAADAAQAIVPPPAEGKAQVVFFRSARLMHSTMAILPTLYDGDRPVGELKNGSYLVYQAEPGAHEFAAHRLNDAALKLTLEAGHTYFVEERLTVGWVADRVNLQQSDEATFYRHASDLTPAQ